MERRWLAWERVDANPERFENYMSYTMLSNSASRLYGRREGPPPSSRVGCGWDSRSDGPIIT
jgi:hypothetical protein